MQYATEGGLLVTDRRHDRATDVMAVPSHRTSGLESAAGTFQRLVALETDDCIIWPRARTRLGYGKLRVGGTHCTTHYLALTVRVGSRPPGMEAAHGPCHNRACMNYRHLSWKTRKDNHADKERDGTAQRGERGGLAVLSDAVVLRLRQMYANGGVTFTELGARFGVDRCTVARAIKGETWGHL